MVSQPRSKSARFQHAAHTSSATPRYSSSSAGGACSSTRCSPLPAPIRRSRARRTLAATRRAPPSGQEIVALPRSSRTCTTTTSTPWPRTGSRDRTSEEIWYVDRDGLWRTSSGQGARGAKATAPLPRCPRLLPGRIHPRLSARTATRGGCASEGVHQRDCASRRAAFAWYGLTIVLDRRHARHGRARQQARRGRCPGSCFDSRDDRLTLRGRGHDLVRPSVRRGARPAYRPDVTVVNAGLGARLQGEGLDPIVMTVEDVGAGVPGETPSTRESSASTRSRSGSGAQQPSCALVRRRSDLRASGLPVLVPEDGETLELLRGDSRGDTMSVPPRSTLGFVPVVAGADVDRERRIERVGADHLLAHELLDRPRPPPRAPRAGARRAPGGRAAPPCPRRATAGRGSRPSPP